MTEQTLTAADFADFYAQVHSVSPFPWQVDLVATVLADACWPDLIDVPTGLGKTSVIDAAVFVAAATVGDPGASRLGRRRCYLVVDRRLVVDEAHTHARRLADALQAAEGAPSLPGRVAAALRSYAPDAGGELLPVVRMRGGTTWEAAWLDRPDRPGIVLGTVDQIGSRLLFRGYGVSDQRRPLDAALVGTDSIVLVDEAHLAVALLTTVTAAQRRDELGLPLPGLTIVRLSATGEPDGRTYRLDEDAHRDHPTAWARLTAEKKLVPRVSTEKNCVRDLARAADEQLDALRGAGDGAPIALVVCNTVDRARAVHTLLARSSDADVELLIGRVRPADRAGLQRGLLDRFGTGRTPADRPAVLVATQTVEVGVNLDVDALVTESASWDALVQRLGRLNRLGRHRDRFPSAPAAVAVVVHDDQADGPVYGAARDATWSALVESDDGTGLDVGPLACRQLSATTFLDPRFRHRPAEVPVLLGPVLDSWVQTGPVPLNDTPVAPYLHGFTSGTAPVQVLWRDGLVEATAGDLTFLDPFDEDDVERAAPQLEAVLAVRPPRTAEIVEVPFGAVRSWLAGEVSGPVADMDGTEDPVSATGRGGTPIRALAQRSTPTPTSAADGSALRWQWIEARDLRPGDCIVVPSQRGGHDRFGWEPTSAEPVVDVSEAVGFTPSRSRREPALCLDSGLAGRLGIEPNEDLRALLREVTDLSRGPDDHDAVATAEVVARAVVRNLSPLPPHGRGWAPEGWEALHDWLAAGRLRIVDLTDPTDAQMPGCSPPLPWVRLLVGSCPAAARAATAVGDDHQVAASSVGAGRVGLAEHLAAVGARAAQIAGALSLPPVLATVVGDAARWHDLGKVEQRFQAMLHGGDAAEAAVAPEPLAKSGMDPTDQTSWRRAAGLSGLPAGARHEQWSAALVRAYLVDHPYAGDADLLVHLIASHHGHARPWARLVHDPAPRPIRAVVDDHEVTVSSEHTVCLDHPGHFADLNRRYGRWGLALLEAVVRCADTTVSGEGS